MVQNKFKVCTRCFTYNHEHFIQKALDGFAMQNTTFPVVTVIVDDASTDNTPAIIRKFVEENFCKDENESKEYETDYAHITLSRHKSNLNCYFAVLYLKENHYGKKSKFPYIEEWMGNAEYHAICEGDDYWTEPDKLQKQVDFLESHPDYVLTCHRFEIFDDELNKWSPDGNERLFSGKEEIDKGGVTFDFRYLVDNSWITKTLSLLYRADTLDEYHKLGNGLDAVLVYFVLKHGLGFCFNASWGVYRKSNVGVCSKQSLEVNMMRGYNAMRDLYHFERTPLTKELFYSKYVSALMATQGKLLLKEPFDIWKFISIFKYLPPKLFRLVIKRFGL